MRVSLVRRDGISEHAPADLESLLARRDGFVWVDLPDVTDEEEVLLTGLFRAHPMVARACRQRTFVPTVHAYGEHVFLVVHAPHSGEGGHVHSLELDQLVGQHYLVTVHGPRNPVVPLEETTAETDQVRERIAAGRFHPSSPAELSYAIVSAVARRQGAAVRSVANRIPALELRVLKSDFQRPEELLEELFLLRHELLVARTMAAQCHDIYARLASLERVTTEETRRFASDLAEQFERTRSVADGESQFLLGVIELYQTRVTTKMTLAMERLAVIAAITLPVTAIASVYGMNVIANDRTHVVHLVIVVLVMVAISLWLLRWARRQGWW